VAGRAAELDPLAGAIVGHGTVTAVRALGLASGWLLDAAAGDPPRRHPVAAFGRVALAAESRWYADRRLRGALHAGVLVAAPAGVVLVAERRLRAPGRLVLVAGLAWAALGGRSLGRAALAVAEAVESGDVERARSLLPALVGRDPSELDAPELCRAALESVAENTADAITGPVVWGALAGAPGVVMHRCANTLDAMVGHRCERYERFGWGSARLDDLLGWLPARITAALAVLCAPLVDGSPARALHVWRRDAGKHPSPNAGPCEAAFAGALGVRLGGENRYGDRVEVRGPLGDGPAPGPGDVRRAVRLSRAIGGLAAALPVAVAAARPLLRERGGAR
jgi:adenosylcobinamide-phosphate synthase